MSRLHLGSVPLRQIFGILTIDFVQFQLICSFSFYLSRLAALSETENRIRTSKMHLQITGVANTIWDVSISLNVCVCVKKKIRYIVQSAYKQYKI